MCEQEITEDQAWNRDHTPPQRFYGKSIRERFNLNLDWLPTHQSCNSAYKSDEEYFVACFAGHADSETGRAIFSDWQRGVKKGHDTGLLKTILNQFGKVVTADGSIVFSFDVDRAGRIAWKLIRGIYFREMGRALPEDAPKRLFMLGRDEAKHAHEKYPWWTLVRDTEPLGEHGMVFDYKWLGTTMVDGVRGHVMGLLLWDRLLVLAVFHDPTCRCTRCITGTWPAEAGQNETRPTE